MKHEQNQKPKVNSKFEEKRQLWFYDRIIKTIEFDLVVVFFLSKSFQTIEHCIEQQTKIFVCGQCWFRFQSRRDLLSAFYLVLFQIEFILLSVKSNRRYYFYRPIVHKSYVVINSFLLVQPKLLLLRKKKIFFFRFSCLKRIL